MSKLFVHRDSLANSLLSARHRVREQCIDLTSDSTRWVNKHTAKIRSLLWQ